LQDLIRGLKEKYEEQDKKGKRIKELEIQVVEEQRKRVEIGDELEDIKKECDKHK